MNVKYLTRRIKVSNKPAWGTWKTWEKVYYLCYFHTKNPPRGVGALYGGRGGI